MNRGIVHYFEGVTLAGSGLFGAAALARAVGFAPRLVAADGGADRLLRLGVRPEAVIGDLDSVSAAAKATLAAVLIAVSEQETTDFEKALRAIVAPFVLGIGFSGGRLDHALAVLNTLVRHPERRCVILGARDLTFAAPPEIALDLPVGSRLSLFPFVPLRGHSSGLRWPIEGLDFAPGGVIGTSNQVVGPVRLRFERPGMLITLPLSALGEVLRSLGLR